MGCKAPDEVSSSKAPHQRTCMAHCIKVSTKTVWKAQRIAGTEKEGEVAAVGIRDKLIRTEAWGRPGSASRK